MSKSTQRYQAPEEAMTSSAKAAHYILWHHEQNPGVRIGWREMAKVLDNLPGLPNRTNAKVVALSRNSHNIGKVMRNQYRMDIQTDPDGIRVLQSGEDITRFSVAKRAKEANLKVNKLAEVSQLALEKKFRDTPESRGLKKFAERAAAGASTAKNQLPSMVDVKGILVSGDD